MKQHQRIKSDIDEKHNRNSRYGTSSTTSVSISSTTFAAAQQRDPFLTQMLLAERYSSPTLHRADQLYSSKDATQPWHTQPLPEREDAVDSQIDYQSLHEALQGLTSVESVGKEESSMMDQQIGSETLLEMLGAQRDLEQQMNAIEQQTSSHHHRYRSSSEKKKTEAFQDPSVVRILYMGACSEKDKRRVFKKISKGLAEALHQLQFPSSSSSFCNFKERKHNLVLMSLLPDDENAIETYEDYGLSVIEADFGWSSFGAVEKAQLDRTLLRYIHHHLHSKSKSKEHQQQEEEEPPLDDEDGFVYPEKSPNGIDLCIYFYNVANDLEESYVKDDMEILWKLKNLGVPIIPVLPINRSTSRAADEEERRLRLANLLAQYKIRCVDLSAFNLNVGRAPSFKKKRRRNNSRTSRSSQASSSLEERLGKEWAASSAALPAPYQILTVDQFAAMDRRAVFATVKQAREQALLERINSDKKTYPTSAASSSSSKHRSPAAPPPPKPHQEHIQSKSKFLLFLCVVLAISILSCHTRPRAQQTRDSSLPPPWLAYLTFATASMQTSTLGFYLELYDPAGNPSWPPRGDPTVVLSGGRNDGPPVVRVDDEIIGRYNFNVSLGNCRNQTTRSHIAIDVQLPLERYVVQGNHIIISPQVCSIDNSPPATTTSSSSSSSSSYAFPPKDAVRDVRCVNSEQQQEQQQRQEEGLGQPISWHEWPKFLFEQRSRLLDIMFPSENL